MWSDQNKQMKRTRKGLHDMKMIARSATLFKEIISPGRNKTKTTQKTSREAQCSIGGEGGHVTLEATAMLRVRHVLHFQ